MFITDKTVHTVKPISIATALTDVARLLAETALELASYSPSVSVGIQVKELYEVRDIILEIRRKLSTKEIL